VGVRFTSFKLVDSFVMVMVGFGNELELTLLGLSILAWPNKENPIVYIELQVLAHYATNSDVIRVEGRLTPNSFILDRNCKLTGGFAMYVWVSGPNEGDFVVTMGGYHPNYKVPAHYPKVDRLALNWKIGPLSIRGEMYFALTPRCIMFGGLLIAEYKLSFLQVTFRYWFDVFISWAPFYYDLSGGVSLKIELTLRILGVRVHYSISFGAKIQLYGPPFGGIVAVDLGFYSFEIPFGKSNKTKPKPLLWTNGDAQNPGFKESFVPVNGNQHQPLDNRIAAGILEVVKDADGKVKTYLVNSYELVLRVDSFFPLTDLLPQNNKGLLNDETLMAVTGEIAPRRYIHRNRDFGVSPMAVDLLRSQLSFCLQKTDGTECNALPLVVVAQSKGMATALWARQAKPGDPAPENAAASALRQIVTGLELHCTEVVDPQLRDFPTGIDRHDIRPQVQLLLASDAGSKFQGFSSANFGGPSEVAAFFNAHGFELETPEKFGFEGGSIEKPLFGANIGQKLPQVK
jgi:hypothetical protein